MVAHQRHSYFWRISIALIDLLFFLYFLLSCIEHSYFYLLLKVFIFLFFRVVHDNNILQRKQHNI